MSKINKPKLALSLGLAAAILPLAACGTADPAANTGDPAAPNTAAGEKNTDGEFIFVVKLSGGDWFNRMDALAQEYGTANGLTVKQLAGDDASEEKQISIISDVIPQQPAALLVVPNSPESVENVLKRARDAGITVITHEAAGITNTDASIEAFEDKAYGAHQMDVLSECMGGEGTYAHIVGSLTVKSHNLWAEGALEHAAATYTGITRVADPISSDENQETAYQRTKELLATNPDIKGFLGSASTDVAGIGRAIEEAGRADDTCVVGTSLPSIAGQLLETGAVDTITFWDPGLAGQAMLSAAGKVNAGEAIAEGTDLGIEGYNSLVPSSEFPNTFFGQAWIDVTKDNAADYPF
ncbi:substrate-binding domain-containing protein [Tessaracoccus caeni]|uniref:substrate-binding domain-containing protein n=1 Tax=Tessaracoccus caeni TaxID=3031239 RepID=UPI0023DC69DD|nr:substrate-binding domain-containing protein [Tessaracoccus caeni]MDF1487923.1 substrate-binding domain-containing protein [Tessaracoccus caeni]